MNAMNSDRILRLKTVLDRTDLAPISPDTLRTLQPEPLETRVVSAS